MSKVILSVDTTTASSETTSEKATAEDLDLSKKLLLKKQQHSSLNL